MKGGGLMAFDTAVGKTVKVLIFVVVSGAIAALLRFFTDNPDFFRPEVVGIINILLVAAKGFFDPKVRNV